MAAYLSMCCILDYLSVYKMSLFSNLFLLVYLLVCLVTAQCCSCLGLGPNLTSVFLVVSVSLKSFSEDLHLLFTVLSASFCPVGVFCLVLLLLLFDCLLSCSDH